MISLIACFLLGASISLAYILGCMAMTGLRELRRRVPQLRPPGRLSHGQRAFVVATIFAGTILLPALLNVLHRPAH